MDCMSSQFAFAGGGCCEKAMVTRSPHITVDIHSRNCSRDASIACPGPCSRSPLVSPGRGFCVPDRHRSRFSGVSVTSSISGERLPAGKLSGREQVQEKYEKLWQELLSDPSQWWDNRKGKPNNRFPDFKHKQTGEGLWVTNANNPRWVASEIPSIPSGVSIFSWAQRLSKYNKAGQFESTLELYEQMQREGTVTIDGYIFVQVLNACAALKLLKEGRQIHQQITETGCELNVYVANSLVDMYGKCGSIADARKMFDKMPRRDVVSWNAMIMGSVKCGQGHKALELFQQMQQVGVQPDHVTFLGLVNACAGIADLEQGQHIHEQIVQSGCVCNVQLASSLIDMYAKCRSIDEAWRVFEQIPKLDVVSWNAMILGFVKCGQGVKALELFEQMEQGGVEPDTVSFVGVLNACASVAALERGKRIHSQIIDTGYEFHPHVSSSLVVMYAKCGSLEDAERFFDRIPTHTVSACTALLLGYAIHGHAEKAVALFEQMSQTGSAINEVSFVCLLSACSHGGLVKEGMHYFDSMKTVYGVSPAVEHYTCIVDLLGRAGYLDDAENFITTMPLEPTAAVWMALLGACRVHGNVEMGERASNRVLEMEPKNASGNVLLSNIFGAAGNWDILAMVQERRQRVGVNEQRGCTCIEVNGEVHSFVVNDRQHPQIGEVQEELARLLEHMKEAGYVPDVRFALLDEEEERDAAHLGGHSEKLALAFGLISTPAGAPLLIVKNLRVCGDCHTATKFISKIVKREISVRDGNRFHLFKDGSCSCGDVW